MLFHSDTNAFWKPTSGKVNTRSTCLVGTRGKGTRSSGQKGQSNLIIWCTDGRQSESKMVPEQLPGAYAILKAKFLSTKTLVEPKCNLKFVKVMDWLDHVLHHTKEKELNDKNLNMSLAASHASRVKTTWRYFFKIPMMQCVMIFPFVLSQEYTEEDASANMVIDDTIIDDVEKRACAVGLRSRQAQRRVVEFQGRRREFAGNQEGGVVAMAEGWGSGANEIGRERRRRRKSYCGGKRKHWLRAGYCGGKRKHWLRAGYYGGKRKHWMRAGYCGAGVGAFLTSPTPRPLF
uniref:Uncharacterized protein n=1 Tax=Timema shepardi TaxID=629360 RepID=A0A7R9G664_TIMSH|nr:unnamed protein product [Timema shepardi]